jgi:hypothetical protein
LRFSNSWVCVVALLALFANGCGESAAADAGGMGGDGGSGGMGGSGGSGPDYYPYLDARSNSVEAKYRVTAVQAYVDDSRRLDGLPVALVIELRDSAARTSASADAGTGVVRWNESVLRGSADSLATSWSVQIVTQEPRGDTVIGECTVSVSPEMITEWGGFETVTCGDVSNLLFRFDMDRKRFL